MPFVRFGTVPDKSPTTADESSRAKNYYNFSAIRATSAGVVIVGGDDYYTPPIPTVLFSPLRDYYESLVRPQFGSGPVAEQFDEQDYSTPTAATSRPKVEQVNKNYYSTPTAATSRPIKRPKVVQMNKQSYATPPAETLSLPTVVKPTIYTQSHEVRHSQSEVKERRRKVMHESSLQKTRSVQTHRHDHHVDQIHR